MGQTWEIPHNKFISVCDLIQFYKLMFYVTADNIDSSVDFDVEILNSDLAVQGNS